MRQEKLLTFFLCLVSGHFDESSVLSPALPPRVSQIICSCPHYIVYRLIYSLMDNMCSQICIQRKLSQKASGNLTRRKKRNFSHFNSTSFIRKNFSLAKVF